jgi:hypothetical protein
VPATFPANFVVETRDTELEVVGPRVPLPGANKAFYRVVAVDSSGNRSGPSDYAEAPRPLIYSVPVTQARLGAPYRCALSTIRSLGDLRTRVIDGKETMSFWDIERPRFVIRRGPAWLSIDRTSGVLSGLPAHAGKADVEIELALESDRRSLDEGALKWGIEKVVASGTATIGTTLLSFAIDVSR